MRKSLFFQTLLYVPAFIVLATTEEGPVDPISARAIKASKFLFFPISNSSDIYPVFLKKFNTRPVGGTQAGAVYWGINLPGHGQQRSRYFETVQ